MKIFKKKTLIFITTCYNVKCCHWNSFGSAQKLSKHLWTVLVMIGRLQKIRQGCLKIPENKNLMHFTQKRLTGMIKHCRKKSSNHHLLTWHLKDYSIDPDNLNCIEFYLPSHQGCFSLNPQVHHFMVFPGTKFSTVDGPYYQINTAEPR